MANHAAHVQRTVLVVWSCQSVGPECDCVHNIGSLTFIVGRAENISFQLHKVLCLYGSADSTCYTIRQSVGQQLLYHEHNHMLRVQLLQSVKQSHS